MTLTERGQELLNDIFDSNAHLGDNDFREAVIEAVTDTQPDIEDDVLDEIKEEIELFLEAEK